MVEPVNFHGKEDDFKNSLGDLYNFALEKSQHLQHHQHYQQQQQQQQQQQRQMLDLQQQHTAFMQQQQFHQQQQQFHQQQHYQSPTNCPLQTFDNKLAALLKLAADEAMDAMHTMDEVDTKPNFAMSPTDTKPNFAMSPTDTKPNFAMSPTDTKPNFAMSPTQLHSQMSSATSSTSSLVMIIPTSDPQDPFRIELREDKKKVFVCKQCGFECIGRANMNKHVKTHDNLKPYKCRKDPNCAKTFGDTSTRARHERVHTKLRYECPKCKYKYTRKDNRDRHLERCKGDVVRKRKQQLPLHPLPEAPETEILHPLEQGQLSYDVSSIPSSPKFETTKETSVAMQKQKQPQEQQLSGLMQPPRSPQPTRNRLASPLSTSQQARDMSESSDGDSDTGIMNQVRGLIEKNPSIAAALPKSAQSVYDTPVDAVGRTLPSKVIGQFKQIWKQFSDETYPAMKVPRQSSIDRFLDQTELQDQTGFSVPGPTTDRVASEIELPSPPHPTSMQHLHHWGPVLPSLSNLSIDGDISLASMEQELNDLVPPPTPTLPSRFVKHSLI